MYRACIAVVDASRARLFTYERTSDGSGQYEELTEQRDLINPARRQRTSALFSDSRPGLGRTGALQYGTDDHRGDHIAQYDTEFSRAVLDELGAMLRRTPARQVIVCASPRMLGELRDVRDARLFADLIVDEVPKDLVKLTPAQLRQQLASYGLLPAVPPRAALM